MYYNTDEASPKYYYAYIIDLEYKNDEVTDVKIETDVFQTWQFDFTYLKSFVERKHVTDDVRGNYTIPEPLETGEYINNWAYHYSLGKPNEAGYFYMVQATQDLNGDDMPFQMYGLPAGCGAYLQRTPLTLKSLLEQYRQAESQQIVSTEAIQSVYVVPSKFVNDEVLTDSKYLGDLSEITYNWNIIKTTTLNGYSPRNKKLLTYPYCYMVMSNNVGITNILHYEKFKSTDCTFIIKGIPTPRLFY